MRESPERTSNPDGSAAKGRAGALRFVVDKKGFRPSHSKWGPVLSPGEPIAISTEERNGFVFVHVADVGLGIEKAEIDQIFAKFYGGKGQRHRVPGTGKGVAVAKAIVEAHGGTIGVASEVGLGSVFTFSLSIEPARKASREAHADTCWLCGS